jgi:hypothetical protein
MKLYINTMKLMNIHIFIESFRLLSFITTFLYMPGLSVGLREQRSESLFYKLF